MISLQNQNQDICFYKVPLHTSIGGKKAVDRTANATQNLLGLHTTKIPNREYN